MYDVKQLLSLQIIISCRIRNYQILGIQIIITAGLFQIIYETLYLLKKKFIITSLLNNDNNKAHFLVLNAKKGIEK